MGAKQAIKLSEMAVTYSKRDQPYKNIETSTHKKEKSSKEVVHEG
jgi:hypothetical protein